MSGHSKWATTKHQKGAKDKARGKLFAKLIRQLEVAAREGGGDLTANANLRTMYQKARDASVPVDTIDRAIKRGTGELEGVRYEAVSYEGYAPCGVAVIVECLTDNRNRTGAEIRSVFSRNGGSMAEPGAVAGQFARKGVVAVPRSTDEEAIMAAALDAGAQDLRDEGNEWTLVCEPGDLHVLQAALAAAAIPIDSAESQWLPTTTVEVADATGAHKVLHLLDLLEDHDDVQLVAANFDIPDEIFDAVSES
ncbi:MAG: YebC/PmpR family DNA-binding transcriptional regulator [Acidimicrobiales bacterium]